MFVNGWLFKKSRLNTEIICPEKTLKNIPILIDRAVFPGTQGGPLEHIIAAKAVAFGEALQPEFTEYAHSVVKNSKALADALLKHGFKLQGGGTDNHLILIDIKSSFGIDGKTYETALDRVGLTLNANALPSDKGGAFRPSGVRLGTPAITTRGLGPKEMVILADWLHRVALLAKNPDTPDSDYNQIRSEVRELSLKFTKQGIIKLWK